MQSKTQHLEIIKVNKVPDAIRSGYSMVVYQNAWYLLYDDLYRFDISTKSWSKELTYGTKPGPFVFRTAVTYKGSMFVFGGRVGEWNITNNLFEYRFRTKLWKQVVISGDLPQARFEHIAAIYNDHLWIFGGRYSNINGEVKLSDIWKIRLTDAVNNWENTLQIGEYPLNHGYYNSAAVDCESHQMYVLQENQIFVFNFKEGSWSSIKIEPVPNLQIGLMVKSQNQLVVIIDKLNVLYTYNLNSRSWSAIIPDSHTPINLNHYYYSRAAVFGNDLYIFGSCVKDSIYKIQLEPSYPECNLHEDYGKLFSTGSVADVELIVGKDEIIIPAHVAIIVSRSEWFRTLIRQVLTKQKIANKNEEMLQVKILEPIVAPKIFEIVVNFIYTDRINLSKNETDRLSLYMDLYNFAVQIRLKSLEQLIIEELNEQDLESLVMLSNVLDILSKADNIGLLIVKEYCLNFIGTETNYMDVVSSNEIQALDSKLILEICRRKPKLANESSTIASSYSISTDSNCLTLAQDMEAFLNSMGEEFSDVNLLVGEYSIPAHKCILSARSSYFEALFRSFMPVDKNVTIKIGEITPTKEAFDAFLKYIYFGDIPAIKQHSLFLLVASDFYGFSNNRFQEIIRHDLEEHGLFDQMVKMLEEAHCSQEIDTKKFLLDLIVERFPKVSSWPQMQTLPSQLLADIIDTLVTRFII